MFTKIYYVTSFTLVSVLSINDRRSSIKICSRIACRLRLINVLLVLSLALNYVNRGSYSEIWNSLFVILRYIVLSSEIWFKLSLTVSRISFNSIDMSSILLIKLWCWRSMSILLNYCRLPWTPVNFIVYIWLIPCLAVITCDPAYIWQYSGFIFKCLSFGIINWTRCIICRLDTSWNLLRLNLILPWFRLTIFINLTRHDQSHIGMKTLILIERLIGSFILLLIIVIQVNQLTFLSQIKSFFSWLFLFWTWHRVWLLSGNYFPRCLSVSIRFIIWIPFLYYSQRMLEILISPRWRWLILLPHFQLRQLLDLTWLQIFRLLMSLFGLHWLNRRVWIAFRHLRKKL